MGIYIYQYDIGTVIDEEKIVNFLPDNNLSAEQQFYAHQSLCVYVYAANIQHVQVHVTHQPLSRACMYG